MRRVDLSTLRKVAEHHLSRHPSTRANLVRVLERRVASHVRKNGVPAPEGVAEMIATVVQAMVDVGLVDDKRFSESKTRAMRSRGKSSRAVRVSLRQKGVTAAVVDDVLRNETGGFGGPATPAEVELDAARSLVRRKKLGAMRESSTPEQRQKDLAIVARAGFRFDVAKRALATPDGDPE